MFINSARRAMCSYCGHGGATRSAGEARASAPIRALVAAIAALLVVLLVPTIAFADSSVIWGPSVLPSQDIGVVVNAPDKYRAAALVLGYGDDKVSTWSDEVLAKLSNESTGGAFYTFAQKFGEVDDAVGNDNPLTAVVSAVGNSFWAIAETLYGDEIWLAGYNSFDFADAASALSSVLSGENIGGGGGSSGSDEEYFIYDFEGLSSVYASVKKLYVPKSMFKFSSGYIDGFIKSGYLSFSAVADGSLSLVEYGFFNDPAIRYSKSGEFHRLDIVGASGHYAGIGAKRISVELRDGALYGKSYSEVINVSGPDYYGTDYLYIGNRNTKALAYFNASTGGGEPVVPPSNWPEEPSAPSPPELPEPGTNPTVTPTPWAPVISPTFDFDLNITTEPSSNDLIDWVKKIYFELRSFHSDEQDWFDEVGKGMDALVDAIDDAQEQIYDKLQTIDETLRSEGQKIRDYMYQMFHWLKDQLNFQNDTFNDSNIVYWLKRIWGKLGDGDVNVRPVDPTVDPPAWWEWLNRMLDSLLDGLVGVFNELLGGTGDLLEEVIHQFPFSIPWDIAAFLTALAAPPVTPVFDIVIPAIDGWWPATTFHVDMSPYNTAAATVRLMTKFVFAGLLAWKSRELLEMMDVTKW